jgi:hypothetical protein
MRHPRKQRLGFLRVLGRETLREPAIDRREQVVGFTRAALVAHQPRIARFGA